MIAIILPSVLSLLISLAQLPAQGFEGYYQYPDLHDNTIVFVAEGDIWKVPIEGGLAQRLTTHAEEEQNPIIAPDGKTMAYSATYEGPAEVYTMPLDGGLPTRRTYSEGSKAVGWTPDGKVIYSAGEFSKLPTSQLLTLDLETKQRSIVPLSSAYHGIQNEDGVWFFVQMPDFNENIKRYQGGTARQIWKYDGQNEAVKLTTGHLGESFNPMWHEGRLYFITDRDGIQNIWSMDAEGQGLKQHTRHTEFDVRSANLDNGKIVYQHAADLLLLDIASGDYNKIDIRLVSDLEHLQETWVENPSKYITSVHPNPAGDQVVVTARGRVFVVPVAGGRTLSFAGQDDTVIRNRDAVFSHDGEHLITLSDQSGEFEFVQLPADGSGEASPITTDGQRLRYQGVPSSDGKWIAYDDVENNMYVLNINTGASKLISTNQQGIRDFSWSPDNQWLAFVQRASNRMYQIKVYNVNDGSLFDLTTDRSNNHSVEWSPDGKFIYFLSDRGFQNLMGSPRDARLGGVYWDKSESAYHVPLKQSYRSPFREKDELMGKGKEDEATTDTLIVAIDKEGIKSRNIKVPIPEGNYNDLEVNDKAIYLLVEETGSGSNSHLKAVKITNEDAKLTDMASGITSFELTQNGEKMLIEKGDSYHLVDAGTGSVNLNAGKIDFSGCKFSINPREDWKQLYKDAWRMERDYFYDKNMHGVDWEAMYEKYLPLVDRVATRNELNQVLARLVGELSVLHANAGGGDIPSDDQYIGVASLGANTSRDEANGGYRIDYIYQGDPDYADFGDWRSPLKDPYLDIQEGDIITKVNGRDALSAIDLGALLRNQAGKQLRLTIKRGNTSKEVVVKPRGGSYWLRTMDWEYHNRLKVEKESNDQIGYLHMNAMGNWDIGHFYREFFPVIHKKGLIIDARFNAGGYTDAIILEKLLRQPFMYLKDRTGEPYCRMDQSFSGHIVVLANERTGSSGESFLIGIKQLGLGTIIGKRTWGGQVWLNEKNKLTDKGVMTAPMHGVYGPEGEWLVEGRGFEPDIELDNLPHETFNGKDAQLDAAIKLLREKIAEGPGAVPPVPDYPDKSFKNNRKN
ncbi:MAG: S41 family peptidase [Phaeodactylibacter sp.]|uniref:S41 family peptidase n=1 Tax=Phaeodactylibacter sp. TaxID=1940289 RepID=UPI0032F065ED